MKALREQREYTWMSVHETAIRWKNRAAQMAARLSTVLGAEVVVLFLVTALTLQFSNEVLGIRNRLIIGVFVIAWLRSAVTKLSEHRRGRYLTWKSSATRQPLMMLALLASAAFWSTLQFLHDTNSSWLAWQSIDLPGWVRGSGAAIALIALVGPRWRSASSRDLVPRPHFLGSSALECQLLIVSMLLMSGSAFIGGLAVAQPVAFWIGRLHQREVPGRCDVIASGPIRSLTQRWVPGFAGWQIQDPVRIAPN